MHCPKCGMVSSDEQKFCRFCGLSLETHSQLLSYQRFVTEPDKPIVESNERPPRQPHKVLRWGFVTLIIASLLLFVAGFENYYLWVGGLALLVSGIVGLTMLSEVPFLFHRRISPKASTTCQLLQAESSARLAEGQHDSLPSVTEHTTQLLEKSESKIPVSNLARHVE